MSIHFAQLINHIFLFYIYLLTLINYQTLKTISFFTQTLITLCIKLLYHLHITCIMILSVQIPAFLVYMLVSDPQSSTKNPDSRDPAAGLFITQEIQRNFRLKKVSGSPDSSADALSRQWQSSKGYILLRVHVHPGQVFSHRTNFTTR